MIEYIGNTKLRYNHLYIDPDHKNKTFCEFHKTLSVLDDLVVIPLTEISSSTFFEIIIYKPYTIKKLFHFSTNTFAITKSEIVNTANYTDGQVSKTDYKIIFDISGTDLHIKINPPTQTEYYGRIIIN